MKQKNYFSLVMPVYNDEKNISKAIQSIINQEYKNWELIIVDDSSTDNSYKIAKEYSSKDNRIFLYKNNSHKGVSYSRDKGIKKSKFNWIANIDSDIIAQNKWLLNASKLTYKFKIFGGPVKYPIPKKGYLRKIYFYLESSLFPKKKVVYNKQNNYSEPPIGGANLFIEKKTYYLLKGFDKDVKIGEDRLLLCNGLKKDITIFYDPELYVFHPLYNYNSLINFFKRSIFFTRGRMLLFKKNNLLEKPYKKSYIFPIVLILGGILSILYPQVIFLGPIFLLCFLSYFLIKLVYYKKIPFKYALGFIFLDISKKIISLFLYLVKLKPKAGSWK